MSARYGDAVDLSKYEAMACGAQVAQTPQDLRRALLVTRHRWTQSSSEDKATRRLQTAQDLEARKKALIERARLKQLPNERQLNAAARLQQEMAAVGACAATSFNRMQNGATADAPLPPKTFEQRVQIATACEGPIGESVSFRAETDDETVALAPVGSAEPEGVPAPGPAALVGYGEAAEARILNAGYEATNAIKAAANQSTEV